MMAALHQQDMLSHLPVVRGSYQSRANLAELTWLRAGGAADIFFTPADLADLQDFLAGLPADIPLTILGAGSNILVRDGGVPGVTIRLGQNFTDINYSGDKLVTVGAAMPDMRLARQLAHDGFSGLEFYAGIPGTIGGAIRMNAGAYGSETADLLQHITVLDRQGQIHQFKRDELGFAYRHCALPEDLIFISATYQLSTGERERNLERIREITSERQDSQPVKSRTGGSTFQNPQAADGSGLHAWQLIADAGCRGLSLGQAQMSEKHCNFMINHGTATAAELEALGEEVRRRVAAHSGVDLQWEIKRLGVAS